MKNDSFTFSQDEWSIISEAARVTGKKIIVLPPNYIYYDDKEVQISELIDLLTNYQNIKEFA